MSIKEYTVRPICRADLRMVLDWRNSESVHHMMLTEHKITWEEHVSWFARVEQEQISRNLIFCYQKKPIGTIAYNAYDETRKTCSPGAYIGEQKEAAIDSAIYLMFMAVEYAFSVLAMNRLATVVFADNKKALGIDQFIGYKIAKHHKELFQKNGVSREAVLIELAKADWAENRRRLLEAMQ